MSETEKLRKKIAEHPLLSKDANPKNMEDLLKRSEAWKEVNQGIDQDKLMDEALDSIEEGTKKILAGLEAQPRTPQNQKLIEKQEKELGKVARLRAKAAKNKEEWRKFNARLEKQEKRRKKS